MSAVTDSRPLNGSANREAQELRREMRDELRERERHVHADRETRAWRNLTIALIPFSVIGAGVLGWTLVRLIAVAVRAN